MLKKSDVNKKFLTTALSLSLPLSVLTAIFRYQNVSILFFIGAKDDGDDWSYKTCKALVKSTPPTTNTRLFTGRAAADDLPVAQPTVSQHVFTYNS